MSPSNDSVSDDTAYLFIYFILIIRWNDITSNFNNHTKYVLESNS